MRKPGIIILLALSMMAVSPRSGVAVRPTPTPMVTPAPVATESAVPATASATKVPENRQDITVPTGEVKGRLERYLDEQKLGPINPTNFIRYAIRAAVKRGVPANTIVLVLLFPVIGALIAATRHVIGLRGFGIYIPAVLSIAFVATGVLPGITMFLVILAIETYGAKPIRKLKMQYLPRMAFLLWLITMGVLATILIAGYFGIQDLAAINIFPILILMLLAENFHEVQLGKSQQEATELTIETMVLSLISALVLSLDVVQRFALLYPEGLILGVAVVDVLIGKYVGLRLTEYLKFRKLLEE